ncbi:hypothetical protein [Leptospira sp. 'Mane']|uniref:hypothetical protein n=1 Tax=Leptospira sp. 'Mane' TaxID=3387407 RepID=UPI00398ABD69
MISFSFFNKCCFYIFALLVCFYSCVQNNGIKNDTLIQRKDAELEYSAVFFMKQVEYFPKEAIYSHRSLHPADACKRDIYYDKSEFRDCMKQISIINFTPETVMDLYFKMNTYINDICKLKKVILFKDSIYKGELNACEING